MQTFLTEIITPDENGDPLQTWAGPDILAKDIYEAYFLLHFCKMSYVRIIGIKVGEVKWN